jgi:hypothetical protein
LGQKEKKQKQNHNLLDGCRGKNANRSPAPWSNPSKQQKNKTGFLPLYLGKSWFFFGTFFFTEKESTNQSLSMKAQDVLSEWIISVIMLPFAY